MMNQALTLSEGPDGLLILTIDNPRASMNVLDRALLPEFAAVLDLLADQSPAGLLICSGKPDSFIAGRSTNAARPVAAVSSALRARRVAASWPYRRPKQSRFSRSDSVA